jgi:hypothetical protein
VQKPYSDESNKQEDDRQQPVGPVLFAALLPRLQYLFDFLPSQALTLIPLDQVRTRARELKSYQTQGFSSAGGH